VKYCLKKLHIIVISGFCGILLVIAGTQTGNVVAWVSSFFGLITTVFFIYLGGRTNHAKAGVASGLPVGVVVFFIISKQLEGLEELAGQIIMIGIGIIAISLVLMLIVTRKLN